MLAGTANARPAGGLSLSADSVVVDSVVVDSVEDEAAAKYDSLANELSRLHSRLNSVEQDREWEKIWRRKKYWKIGMGSPKIERTDGEEMTWKTDFAVFLQRGKTAYFHSKPLLGMIKLGLDYGFLDIYYAKLKYKTPASGPSGKASDPSGATGGGSGSDGFDDIVSDEPSGSVGSPDVNLCMHKFEYSLHVGPSISVNPWNHIIVAAYFHVMPTASGIIENDTFSYGFGCAMSAGLSVAYKAISVGVEGLWSKLKYRQASFDEDSTEEDIASGNIFTTKDFKLKQKGPRFYIALRF